MQVSEQRSYAVGAIEADETIDRGTGLRRDWTQEGKRQESITVVSVEALGGRIQVVAPSMARRERRAMERP